METLHHGYRADCGHLRLVINQQHDHVIVRIFDTNEPHGKGAEGKKLFDDTSAADMDQAKALAIQKAGGLGVECQHPKWEPYQDMGTECGPPRPPVSN
jgi:hypothetical protein